MKYTTWALPLLALLSALGFAAAALLAEAETPERSQAPSEHTPVEHPRSSVRVQSAADLVGGIMDVGGRDLTIQELVWGESRGGALCYALLKGEFANGESFHYENFEACERLMFQPSEFTGTRLYDPAAKKYHEIQSLSYILLDGRVVFDVLNLGQEGAAGSLLYIRALDTTCCGLHQTTTCAPATGCTSGCNSPITCECGAPPTGSCTLNVSSVCRGACSPTACQTIIGECNGSVEDCKCVTTTP